MTVRFTPTAEEVLEFHKHFYETDPNHTRSRKRTVWLSAAFYVVIGLLIAAGNTIPSRKITAIVIFTVISLLWLLFSPRYIVHLYLKQAEKRMADQGNQAMYYAEREMTFGEDFIHAKTAEAEEKLQWSAIIRGDETNDAYYLFNSTITAFILPKRVLTVSEENELRLLLAKHNLLNPEK